MKNYDKHINSAKTKDSNQNLHNLHPMDGYMRYYRSLHELDNSACVEQIAEYLSEMDSAS